MGTGAGRVRDGSTVGGGEGSRGAGIAGATNVRDASTIGAIPEGLATVFGAGTARGVSTDGAIGKVTAAPVEGGAAVKRASGVDGDGAETTTTVCAGGEGVAAACVAAPATVALSFGAIAVDACAPAGGAVGCTTAAVLAAAADDTVGIGGVRTGNRDEATTGEAPLVRLDATSCARGATGLAEVAARDPLLARASCL